LSSWIEKDSGVKYFKNWEILLAKLKFKPCLILKTDESAANTVPTKTPKVISSKEKDHLKLVCEECAQITKYLSAT
jgi:hypothetical protein